MDKIQTEREFIESVCEKLLVWANQFDLSDEQLPYAYKVANKLNERKDLIRRLESKLKDR